MTSWEMRDEKEAAGSLTREEGPGEREGERGRDGHYLQTLSISVRSRWGTRAEESPTACCDSYITHYSLRLLLIQL